MNNKLMRNLVREISYGSAFLCLGILQSPVFADPPPAPPSLASSRCDSEHLDDFIRSLPQQRMSVRLEIPVDFTGLVRTFDGPSRNTHETAEVPFISISFDRLREGQCALTLGSQVSRLAETIQLANHAPNSSLQRLFAVGLRNAEPVTVSRTPREGIGESVPNAVRDSDYYIRLSIFSDNAAAEGTTSPLQEISCANHIRIIGAGSFLRSESGVITEALIPAPVTLRQFRERFNGVLEVDLPARCEPGTRIEVKSDKPQDSSTKVRAPAKQNFNPSKERQ